MKSKPKQRRILNINKDDFDVIKVYCDENALNMSKWIVQVSKEKIPVTIENIDHYTLNEILTQICKDETSMFVSICELVDQYCNFKEKNSMKARISFLTSLAKILQLPDEELKKLKDYFQKDK